MEEDITSIKSCIQSTKIGSREEDPYKNLLSILANCAIGKSHEWAMQHAQTWVNIVENFNFQKYGSSASDAEFGRKVAEDIDHLSRSLGSPAFEIIESGVNLEQLESEMNFKLRLMDEEHVQLTAIKNRFVEKPSEVLTEYRVSSSVDTCPTAHSNNYPLTDIMQ
jgi:hypothetical protein